MNLQNWLAKVVAERARMLTRVGPIEPKINPRQEQESIERAAAALLEWEHATGQQIDQDSTAKT